MGFVGQAGRDPPLRVDLCAMAGGDVIRVSQPASRVPLTGRAAALHSPPAPPTPPFGEEKRAQRIFSFSSLLPSWKDFSSVSEECFSLVIN